MSILGENSNNGSKAISVSIDCNGQIDFEDKVKALKPAFQPGFKTLKCMEITVLNPNTVI